MLRLIHTIQMIHVLIVWFFRVNLHLKESGCAWAYHFSLLYTEPISYKVKEQLIIIVTRWYHLIGYGIDIMGMF